MTISKKFFMAAAIVASFSGNAAFGLSSKYAVNFDYTLLRPLVSRSKSLVESTKASFDSAKAVCFNAKECAKKLYEQQKNALKTVLVELKQAYKTAKLAEPNAYFGKKQLYKMYKKLVYKTWKKDGTFANF